MATPYPDTRTAVLATPDLTRNALIGALPPHAIGTLTEARTMYFRAPFVAQPAGESLKFVLFPLDAMFSVMMHLKDGSSIEVASIAAEGMLAEAALLGGKDAMFEYSCEVAGHAFAMSVGTLERLARSYPAFRAASESFLRFFVFSVGQIAACNRHHSIEQRIARWLLTAHKCGNDRIAITHDRLATLLGARRAGISTALARLQRLRCVSRGHRHVTVTNRRILEQVSCECYAALRAKML